LNSRIHLAKGRRELSAGKHTLKNEAALDNVGIAVSMI
jgi:hypothetical protein